MQKTKHNLLLVDDSQINNLLLESAFKNSNFNISVASSGKEALVFLEKDKFDLIILDILMPKMSGFDLLEKLTDVEKNSDTPVLFVTASDYKHEKENVSKKHKGIVDFFEKPIDIEKIKEKVNEILDIN